MVATASRGGIKTYDSNQTTLIINNVAITGYGDTDTFAISRNSDDYSGVAGADGEYTYSALNDRSGTITVSLSYGSRANRTMMELVNSDRSNNGGVTDITFTDKRGGSVATARGRVQRVPDATIGREVGVMDWVFLCADIDATWIGLPQD